MDRVHIIMAVYNGEAYLREQIRSIRENTYTGWILWIFDDGSGDSTPDIIRSEEKEDRERIRYIRNAANKGVTRNFLEGLKTAAADGSAEVRNYYMFCDQDDVWMPDKIEKTLKAMKKLEKKYSGKLPLAVFTDAVIADEDLKPLNPSFHKSNRLDTGKLDLPHILMENKLIGCTLMLNSPLEKKLTPLPEKARYHDWWIGLVGAAFGRIAYLPVPTLYYRQHGRNVVGNQDFKGYVRNRLRSLKEQKRALCANSQQAAEFLEIYKECLPEDKKMQVYAMAKLMEEGWLLRRYRCIRYGFWKTGLVRNAALMLIL